MTATAKDWMPWRKGPSDGPDRLSLFVEKVPAGWRLDLGGRVRHFGTGFLAVETATGAARAAARSGCPARVLVEQASGGWRTAWSSDESLPA